jgi:hypothetical protein
VATPSNFPGEQRERIASFLTHQRTGVISAVCSSGVCTLLVRYRTFPGHRNSRSLEVDCLIPRWAGIADQLTPNTRIVLVVQASSEAGLRWLQIQGAIRPVEAPDWSKLLPHWISTVHPDGLYQVIRVTPIRIDLIDEDLGWGIQETLEW